jgi:hypothetical protein
MAALIDNDLVAGQTSNFIKIIPPKKKIIDLTTTAKPTTAAAAVAVVRLQTSRF